MSHKEKLGAAIGNSLADYRRAWLGKHAPELSEETEAIFYAVSELYTRGISKGCEFEDDRWADALSGAKLSDRFKDLRDTVDDLYQEIHNQEKAGEDADFAILSQICQRLRMEIKLYEKGLGKDSNE